MSCLKTSTKPVNIGVRKANSNMSEKQSFSEHTRKSSISDELEFSKRKLQLKHENKN